MCIKNRTDIKTRYNYARARLGQIFQRPIFCDMIIHGMRFLQGKQAPHYNWHCEGVSAVICSSFSYFKRRYKYKISDAINLEFHIKGKQQYQFQNMFGSTTMYSVTRNAIGSFKTCGYSYKSFTLSYWCENIPPDCKNYSNTFETTIILNSPWYMAMKVFCL